MPCVRLATLENKSITSSSFHSFSHKRIYIPKERMPLWACVHVCVFSFQQLLIPRTTSLHFLFIQAQKGYRIMGPMWMKLRWKVNCCNSVHDSQWECQDEVWEGQTEPAPQPTSCCRHNVNCRFTLIPKPDPHKCTNTRRESSTLEPWPTFPKNLCYASPTLRRSRFTISPLF
jgi:hypothetical protein